LVVQPVLHHFRRLVLLTVAVAPVVLMVVRVLVDRAVAPLLLLAQHQVAVPVCRDKDTLEPTARAAPDLHLAHEAVVVAAQEVQGQVLLARTE
jgi:hypothetical protein